MAREHHFPVRVYYEDTDSGGIVYYANYLKFAERGRTELLRELGFESQAILDTHGLGLAVRRCHIDYLKPAKLDDMITVKTEIRKVGGASMELHQAINRDEVALAQLEIKLGSVHFESGRPVGLPKELRSSLQRYINANQNFDE